MKNIAVIFGGKSVEHDISIITALQVMESLPKSYNLIPIYIKSDGKFVSGANLTDKNIYLNFDKCVKGEKEVLFFGGRQTIAFLKNGKIKEKTFVHCALLCNHGHGGEDGSLQGLLELCEIPYSSCSIVSSGICMDKAFTKIILESGDIHTPAYVHFDIREYAQNFEKIKNQIVEKIQFPCIVKPARLGSSVGIDICEDVAELEKKIENALQFDDKVLVEKFVENAREFCCAVLSSGDELFESKVSEVTKGKIFTFEEKYIENNTLSKREISKDLENRIKKLAKRAYSLLECKGVVRVDFLYDEKDDNLFVNEVNTIPGSLAFHLFDTSFADILNTLIVESINANEKKKKILYQFNSSAIESYISSVNNLKRKI